MTWIDNLISLDLIKDLKEFYVLYTQEIQKKYNAKVYNLLEIYEPQILS
jgi:hypothetical protein